MTTTLTNCELTDALQANDVYRITLIPVPGFFGAVTSDANESLTVQTAMDAIYAAGSIDNVTTYANPLEPNPFATGALACTFDNLITFAGGAVSDLLTNLLAVAEGSVSGFFNDFSSAALSNVQIQTCERVVGAGAATAGTPDASTAVYSPQAAATRASEAAAASAAASAAATNNWLTELEGTVGTVGTYLVIGAGVLGLLWLARKAKQAGVFG